MFLSKFRFAKLCFGIILLTTSFYVAANDYFCIDDHGQAVREIDGESSNYPAGLLKERVQFDERFTVMTTGRDGSTMRYECNRGLGNLERMVFCMYDDVTFHSAISFDLTDVSYIRADLVNLPEHQVGSITLGKCHRL